ncbi:hypothetical protein METSCH_B10110 [Metschnikowia aff. pulcherrima]|uniref:Uncharacterized protein n=1 Tax=Metschnikowia aff. pulcherrima TaxID=2163413 RepID=A0A4P6XLW1_9ASCO|nr:hypothetical protein METSCH_B10110 [Metschnikowia aff. pulcherrima]
MPCHIMYHICTSLTYDFSHSGDVRGCFEWRYQGIQARVESVKGCVRHVYFLCVAQLGRIGRHTTAKCCYFSLFGYPCGSCMRTTTRIWRGPKGSYTAENIGLRKPRNKCLFSFCTIFSNLNLFNLLFSLSSLNLPTIFRSVWCWTTHWLALEVDERQLSCLSIHIVKMIISFLKYGFKT